MSEVNTAISPDRKAWFTPGVVRSGPKQRFGEAWERQTAEPARAFAAFVVYRELGGDRSLDAVAAHPDVTYRRSSLTNLAATWSWVDRARAYDNMLDRRRAEAAAKEVEAMARRHVELAMALQVRGAEFVKHHLDTVEKLKKMTPGVALRFIEHGINIERQARGVGDGQPEEVVPERQIDPTRLFALFDKIDQMRRNMEAIKTLSPGGTVVDTTVAEDGEVDQAETEGEPE